MEIFKALLEMDALVILANVVLVVVADTVLGICVALRNRTFDWQALPDVLQYNVLPYIGGLGILALLARSADIRAVFLAAVALYLPKLLLDIAGKVRALFGPIPIEHG